MKADWRVLVIAFALPCLVSLGWKTGSVLSEVTKAAVAGHSEKTAEERAHQAEVRAHNATHCFVTGSGIGTLGFDGPEKTYGPVIEIKHSSSEGRTLLELVWGAEVWVKISSTKDCKK